MKCVCALLLYVCCPALWIFSTFSHERHNLKKKLPNTKSVWFSLQSFSEIFLILRTNERDRIKYVHRSSRKVPLYSCPFSMKLELSRQAFERYFEYQILWKCVQWKPTFPCGRTGMTNLVVAFRNFKNEHKQRFIFLKCISHKINVMNSVKSKGILL
jgi:hypothetical protein